MVVLFISLVRRIQRLKPQIANLVFAVQLELTYMAGRFM
jgi:hypothetical protein